MPSYGQSKRVSPLASWLAIYHCVITCNFECKRLKRLVTWAAYLSGAAATDCDEPPSFTSRLERLRRLTVNSTVLRCHAACPTFTLRQVDDLVVLRPQHRLLLMTVLRRQTDRQTEGITQSWLLQASRSSTVLASLYHFTAKS